LPNTNDHERSDFINQMLARPCSEAVGLLAGWLQDKFSDCAILLYGSGNSVLSQADPSEILFDFYVIVPSYRKAYGAGLMAFLNYAIPPNVYYLEETFGEEKLRAKYAILSLAHFEKLVSKKTFHSYFWARFAQPSVIVAAPDDMRERLGQSVETAVDTFVYRAAPLAGADASVGQIWRQGLARSYKAELRAEQPGRVDDLLASYGDWPDRVTCLKGSSQVGSAWQSHLAWRLRALQGAFLSVIRLLKGTVTFQGGVDYIAWKISRHAGFTLPVKNWERRFPILGAPFLGARYYRLKRALAERSNHPG
jgi:hypothetical protein